MNYNEIIKTGSRLIVVDKSVVGFMGINKSKNKKCFNCKHAGKQFKIAGKTHLYCRHSKNKKDIEKGNIDPIDVLNEFWNTCEDHEKKPSQALTGWQKELLL